MTSLLERVGGNAKGLQPAHHLLATVVEEVGMDLTGTRGRLTHSDPVRQTLQETGNETEQLMTLLQVSGQRMRVPSKKRRSPTLKSQAC